MSGFLDLKLRPWIRRVATRLLAIVPAVITILSYGDSGMNNLLILSQVILSFQLPFAVIPLVFFTSSSRIMGQAEVVVDRSWFERREESYSALTGGQIFRAGKFLMIISSFIALLITFLNIYLVIDSIGLL